MLIRNPATEAVIAELPEDAPAQVDEKVRAARRAQPEWAGAPLAERLATIRRFRDAVVREKERLALVLTREMGKPVAQANNELTALPARLDFFLENTEAVLREEVVHREPASGEPTLLEAIRQEPLGVIGNVSAWNYPWFVGSNVFVPALLTGNAVVYKPSEHASMTGLEIARLLHESGVPRDVFSTAIGGGPVGAALVSSGLDGVFFTGSYATGKRIAEAVSSRLVKLGLELGGKDPTYVCEDVDVRAAAESLADGAMYNSGQSCCSVERIYVAEAIFEPFVEAFVEVVRGFEIGDPEDPSTYIGPLAREDQLGVLDAQVEDALAKGARLALGGHRVKRTGYYFEPTVLTAVHDRMRVLRDESFGPIIGIASVANDEAAVQSMNDTEYGLTAGVYTKSRERAERILSRVDAGSVYWNCCDRVSPRLPWTGRRHSGIGSTLSTYGIRAFLQPKAWHWRAPT